MKMSRFPNSFFQYDTIDLINKRIRLTKENDTVISPVITRNVFNKSTLLDHINTKQTQQLIKEIIETQKKKSSSLSKALRTKQRIFNKKQRSKKKNNKKKNRQNITTNI